MFDFIAKITSRSDSECSFSQSGEDRIIKFLFDVLEIQQYRYLDIGAHHPRRLSNTYLFYTLGGSGVLVEPNPCWTSLIAQVRPRDFCLNVGLAGHARSGVPFYVMKSDTLCTFSKQEAERMVSECGEEISEVQNLDVLAPETVLSAHFSEGLNLVSMDVEGLELEILEAFDLQRYRPEVFCIETISYAINGAGVKSSELTEFMAASGYMVFADTFINTIFVDRCRWESLGQ
jgi:FkbM family methyltransferase